MSERTQYRSKIDEIVCKSGLSGSSIAREMGITTNRIIALRRATDHSISIDDVSSCEAAIVRLGGIVQSKSDDDIEKLRFHLGKVTEIIDRIKRA
ncbi:MAG: hypothetical protein P9L97_08950 [Candidatus Tenebribacter davisii]|nr:hypothetical protein [Candidatus Tenebribacter davisii]